MNSILQKFHHYSEMVVLRGLTLLIFIDFCRIFIITMSRFFMHLIIGSVCRKFVSATLFTEMVEFGNWIIYLGLVIFSSKDDEWAKYDSSLAFVLFRHLRYCSIIGTKLRADFEAWLVGSLRWDCGSFWFSSVGSFKTSYCKLSIISEKIRTIYYKIKINTRHSCWMINKYEYQTLLFLINTTTYYVLSNIDCYKASPCSPCKSTKL